MIRMCKEENCGNTVYAKGQCRKHYDKLRRPTVSFHNRFWSKVLKRKHNECWLWSGCTYNTSGYGKIQYNKTVYLAHRLMWYMTYGVHPGKLFVCHKCDNPPCVNPDHLFLGTSADNMHDMWEKGRSPIGESHKNTKLTEKQARLIKEKLKAGLNPASIAKELNLNYSLVSAIHLKRTWKHIEI